MSDRRLLTFTWEVPGGRRAALVEVRLSDTPSEMRKAGLVVTVREIRLAGTGALSEPSARIDGLELSEQDSPAPVHGRRTAVHAWPNGIRLILDELPSSDPAYAAGGGEPQQWRNLYPTGP